VFHSCGNTVVALADDTAITIVLNNEAPEACLGAGRENLGTLHTGFKPFNISSSNHTFYF
jgi:hypothetical protein